MALLMLHPLPISIHALREESGEGEEFLGVFAVGISIHALREESGVHEASGGEHGAISIHALREESGCDRETS